MMTLVFIFLFLATSALLYVEAFKFGMNQNRWAVAGLFLGPAVIPMFSIQRQVQLRQRIGFNNVIMSA